MIKTNIAGDLEFSNSTLAFEMPVLVHNNNEVVLDEFDSVIYQGAKYTITTVNESGQIEINELMVIHDGTTAFDRPVATLNNIISNSFIASFRSELLRGKVRVFITGVGNKNKTRFFKLMFKK
jgi:hypothetical protein